MGQVIVVIDNNAAVAQCVGMDGDAGGADLFRSRDGLLEVVQILLLVGRVDERVVCIAVEAGDRDACLLGSLTGRIQIADAPVPELYGLKAIVFCRLKAVEASPAQCKGYQCKRIFSVP